MPHRHPTSTAAAWPGVAVAIGLALVASLCSPAALGAPPQLPGAELRLARRLAAHAEQQRDALAMLAAARIAAASGVQHLVRGDAVPWSDSLFDRAQVLAAGRTDLLALIEDARAVRTRQSVGGGMVHTAVVRAHDSMRVRLSFQPGTQALFGVDPDTAGDLRLRVLGPEGNELCRRSTAQAALRIAKCVWSVDASGAALIDIDNQGPQAVELTYFHN